MNNHAHEQSPDISAPEIQQADPTLPRITEETKYEKSSIEHESVTAQPTGVQAQQSDDNNDLGQQTAPQSSDKPVNSPISTDSPLIADDVDVIEKEWVDKAKKIIELTADDPYTQENEIEKLQIDYLYKRFGKKIKSSDG